MNTKKKSIYRVSKLQKQFEKKIADLQEYSKGIDAIKSDKEDAVPNQEESEDEEGSVDSVDINASRDAKRMVSNQPGVQLLELADQF